MKWTPKAESAIKKVPFFVRKKVRLRVEREADAAGKTLVRFDDVKATQERYLQGMASEVTGYQLDVCFGPNGCPNRAGVSDVLVEKMDRVLREADLKDFLKGQVGGSLKYHHEFRVTVAECPNACSQPQIKDVGVIGAVRPRITDAPCTGCGACQRACPDGAIGLHGDRGPVIDASRCLACGKCISACGTGTLAEGTRGWKVLLAGKLGRHPRLARQLPGIYDEHEVLDILRSCLVFYKTNGRAGKRFAEIFTPQDIQTLARHLSGAENPGGTEGRTNAENDPNL